MTVVLYAYQRYKQQKGCVMVRMKMADHNDVVAMSGVLLEYFG
jgi:hypothetical protein